MTDSEGGTITYSTKQMLDRLDQKIDHILEELRAKATIAETHALSLRLTAIEEREKIAAQAVLTKETLQRATTDRRRWAIPTVLTVVYLVSSVLIHTNVHW